MWGKWDDHVFNYLAFSLLNIEFLCFARGTSALNMSQQLQIFQTSERDEIWRKL